MTTPSFKSMVAEKQIKRADAYKIRIEDIHEEPGFNLRLEGPDLDASIAAIADHIADGGLLPALEVRPRADGGVLLVDRHRRRRGYLLALERGVPLRDPKTGEVWIEVKQFEGNDADRVARIMTSAEGRALQPIETAEGYRRLRAYGWTNEQIARKVGRTSTHVGQMLLLSSAPAAVQRLVKEGVASASVAVKAFRKHGDNTEAVLAVEHAKAKSIGRDKVTDGTMAGKIAPKSAIRALIDSCGDAYSHLPASVRVRYDFIRSCEMQQTVLPEGDA